MNVEQEVRRCRSSPPGTLTEGTPHRSDKGAECHVRLETGGEAAENASWLHGGSCFAPWGTNEKHSTDEGKVNERAAAREGASDGSLRCSAEPSESEAP